MPFQPIGSLVKRAVKRAGIDKSVSSSLAIEQAEYIIKQLMGDELSTYVKPVYIRYRILTIASLNSAAAALVGRYEESIIQYVNDACKRSIVDRIRIIA